MKVLGLVNDRTYLAEVSHQELEKLADSYYGGKSLPKMKPGEVMDLGAGHDFRDQIRSACKQMQDATESFERAQQSLFKFAIMVGQLPAATPDEGDLELGVE